MMKRLSWLRWGLLIAAGVALYLYQRRQQAQQAATRLQAKDRENTVTEVETPVIIAEKTEETPETLEENISRLAREHAWSIIPDWLERSPGTRRTLILEATEKGIGEMYPDAEMIEKYHRLKAEGKLNPADFITPFSERDDDDGGGEDF